jgi:hypothetical protein
MFQLGKRYNITMMESGGYRTEKYGCLVIQVDLPLLEIEHSGSSSIINTSSSAFVSAELSSNQTGERPLIDIADFGNWGSSSNSD